MSEHEQQRGLGFEILVKEEILAVRNLREQLEAVIPKDKKPAPWTREEAIQVLNAVKIAVGKFMDTRIAIDAEDITEIVEEHPVTRLLEQLAEALKDLKNGNVDDRLKPTEGLGGAAYNAGERSDITRYLEFVEIHRRSKIERGKKKYTYEQARKQISEYLAKRGMKIRGELITPERLYNWRRYPPGKPRRHSQ